jgi:hypothetical protein
MKIWISDTQTPTHRLVRLHCEGHSDYTYLGDLDDEALQMFLFELQETMDIQTNIKRLHYYGYLHLFILNKNKR